MRLLIADSSALSYYLLGMSRGARVGHLLSRGDYDLHVPHVCDVEMLSTIRRAMLENRLERGRALEALADYLDLPITRHGHMELLPRGLGLSSSFTPADAMYVALAELLDGILLTGDQRLARAVAIHTRVAVEEI
jgi:predicted nucleic acid-binding protein